LQTSAIRLIEYFDGRKQSVIPLFQRPYTWDNEQWKTLWNDILACRSSDEKLSPHFMGAIVSLSVTTTPVGVNKHLIIDGQQRLTTVSLLLCALRPFMDDKVRDRIQDFLINRHDEGGDKLKVMPTHDDKGPYDSLVSQRPRPEIKSQILKANDFFKKKLENVEDDEGVTPSQVLDIIESALRVVMINLDSETEDPYEIFESLNFKGTALSPADLVRNFILMKYRHSLGDDGEQKRVFDEYWQPIEQNCKDADLPQFLMHYCRMSGREVRKKAIYPQFKAHMDGVAKSAGPALEEELRRLKSFSAIYPRLFQPELESDERVARSLRLFNSLGVTVCYPVLLRIFGLEHSGAIVRGETTKALSLIEDYLIRRAVCNLKNNALDSMFSQILVDWVDSSPAEFIRAQFTKQTGNLRWPREAEFIEQFATAPQYGRKSTSYVLWQIERSYGHKEVVKEDEITIEHILPQTPCEEWYSGLSDAECKELERWADTYGNLTLTGYNPELGNAPFEKKRGIYTQSNLQMTKDVANESGWSVDSIRARGQRLARTACEIWGGPSDILSPP
jgi:uncharacterized protein with ParB-like and HNH nuclease domain